MGFRRLRFKNSHAVCKLYIWLMSELIASTVLSCLLTVFTSSLVSLLEPSNPFSTPALAAMRSLYLLSTGQQANPSYFFN